VSLVLFVSSASPVGILNALVQNGITRSTAGINSPDNHMSLLAFSYLPAASHIPASSAFCPNLITAF